MSDVIKNLLEQVTDFREKNPELVRRLGDEALPILQALFEGRIEDLKTSYDKTNKAAGWKAAQVLIHGGREDQKSIKGTTDTVMGIIVPIFKAAVLAAI